MENLIFLTSVLRRSAMHFLKYAPLPRIYRFWMYFFGPRLAKATNRIILKFIGWQITSVIGIFSVYVFSCSAGRPYLFLSLIPRQSPFCVLLPRFKAGSPQNAFPILDRKSQFWVNIVKEPGVNFFLVTTVENFRAS